MNGNRRNFLKQCLATSAGFAGLNGFLASRAYAQQTHLAAAANGYLQLPEGFSATIISKWGDRMTDGFVVPGRADGMAAFDDMGKVVIIRNHENSPTPADTSAFGEDMSLFNRVNRKYLFDYGYGKTPGLGGTTTIVFDEEQQKVKEQYLTLAGTYRNCAGGPTPWNSWITCEEDTAKRSEFAETNHGYNFEVPASSRTLVEPVALKAMGRFNHEAVCVDPNTGIVYQTEDRHDSLIYRFIPAAPGQLHKGGVLQALCIKDARSFDTRNWEQSSMKVGEPFDVEWITLKDVDTDEDDLRMRGFAQGAALFARGEGMWFGNNEVYFACTNGGRRKTGQVFRYRPAHTQPSTSTASSMGTLTLFAEPNDTNILKFCDNLTVAPWGDVILVEDTPDAYIRGITTSGRIYDIGKNIGSRSELAGVCFSPSGKTMFVNIQEQGLTLAITGPWSNLRPGI